MIDNTKEYISMSAIHIDDGKFHLLQEPYGITSGYVVGGFRHPYIMAAIGIPEDEFNCTFGFVTSYGRFVTRLEAVNIAVEAGQVKREDLNLEMGLYSEDIFKYQLIQPE